MLLLFQILIYFEHILPASRLTICINHRPGYCDWSGCLSADGLQGGDLKKRVSGLIDFLAAVQQLVCEFFFW